MDVLERHFTDQGKLLDIIDSLRSQGLGNYISLPQLVVCGDQSAGKSSVLEAISSIAFPIKDNLCTRFATEVLLRRDAESSFRVMILPDGNRPEEEKDDLRGFQMSIADLQEVPELVEKAKEKMGLNRNTNAFSRDILRIELSGPTQPYLTLVDLPGLVHSESKKHTTQDVDLVKSLVREYMASDRSIILAVVSAQYDYPNQIVTSFAREFDPHGSRTLGIITKPDELKVGSESEAAYVELARNKDVRFRLGWHLLRNRDFHTRGLNTAERDELERNFFASGVWRKFPLHCLGVESLRPRLSDVLKEQITAELPSLIKDIESGLSECRKRLQHLGNARETIQEQRLYLIRTSETFSALLRSASDGVYDRDFFGDARTDVGFRKRLRAVMQDLLLDFADTMRRDGHSQRIIDDDSEDTNGEINTKTQTRHRGSIPRSAYLEDVGELMRRTRGRELPGTFNPMIVGDLFFAQSKPWHDLVVEYTDRAIVAARTTVELILSDSCDAPTTESLLREIVNPALEKCVNVLRKKVEEILRPHLRGHPITYNHYFTDTIQKARRDHEKKKQAKVLHAFFGRGGRTTAYSNATVDIDKLLEALNPETESDMNLFACSEATYCMEAYYKVAMKTLVDSFAVLGIEACLLGGLKDVFTAETVMRLADDVVQRVAQENEESVTERKRTQEKLRVLEQGLDTLTRYRRYNYKEPGQPELEKPNHGEPDESVHGDLTTMINEDKDEAITVSPAQEPEYPPPPEDEPLAKLYEEETVNHDAADPWGATVYRPKKKKSIKSRAAAFEEDV